MRKKLTCKSLQELPSIARFLLKSHMDKRLFAFYGSMGVGKTTFIKEICSLLCVENMVNSPTYSIVNEYFTSNGESIYHFDFYRIKKKEEALDIGCEEYLYSGDYCFIEWPEKIEELLPKNVVYVSIKENLNDGSRNIEF